MNKFLKILGGIGYWLWSLTWGALMTIPGLLITGFCIVFLHGKPHRNGYSYIVEVGGDWGGLEIGAVSLCGRYSQKDGPCYSPDWFYHTRCHEFGHSVQQLIFGPLQPFIVGIPSVIRYWVFYFRIKKGLPVPEYDQAIYEYTASKWGYKWINLIENTDVKYNFKRTKNKK